MTIQRVIRTGGLVAFVAWCSVLVQGQVPATGRVMREKMGHAHGVFVAIMTSDFKALKSHSESLRRATESPAWSVLKSPEYMSHSTAFLRASEDLVQAADERNLDDALTHYVELTRACYQCHRYIKGARVAVRNVSPPREIFLAPGP